MIFAYFLHFIATLPKPLSAHATRDPRAQRRRALVQQHHSASLAMPTFPVTRTTPARLIKADYLAMYDARIKADKRHGHGATAQ